MAITLCKAVGGRLLSVWMMMEGIPGARKINKSTKKIGGQSQGNVENNDIRPECTFCGTRMTRGKIVSLSAANQVFKGTWLRSDC